MQVHHGFDVKNAGAYLVNDGIGKAVEFQLSMAALHFRPAFRFGHDAAQSALKFVQKGIPQTQLPILIPQRRGLELLLGFRMADDVQGGWRECPEQFPPPDGT